uniref:YCII-related domain-containing protein n=1 Tax=Phaeomonas parva TaxID=124430 RepID=A0A7S1UBC4_9STRA|mmetsp:Transcript_3748/g.10774  ORF Transcript_3748/g.10774 Transcript_3748/m.10774 type:complete len:434 (+) Transcript_3748:132-1433(+)
MARAVVLGLALGAAMTPCGGFRLPKGYAPRDGASALHARRKAAAKAEVKKSVPEIIFNRPSVEELSTPHIPHDYDVHVVTLSTLHEAEPADEPEANARQAAAEALRMRQSVWAYAPYRLRAANNATGLRAAGAALCSWDTTLLDTESERIEGGLYCVQGQDAGVLAKMAATSPVAAAGASAETFVFKPNDAPELNWQFMPHPFAMVCLDKPKSGELRAATRPAHLEYLKGLDCVVQGGPLFDPADEGKGPVGSLVLFSAEDMEAAQAIAAEDPYALAGLFESTRIFPLAVADVTGRNLATRRALDERDVMREVLEECELAEHWDYPEKQIFYRTLQPGEIFKEKEDEQDKVLKFDGERLHEVTASELAAIMEGEAALNLDKTSDKEEASKAAEGAAAPAAEATGDAAEATEAAAETSEAAEAAPAADAAAAAE